MNSFIRWPCEPPWPPGATAGGSGRRSRLGKPFPPVVRSSPTSHPRLSAHAAHLASGPGVSQLSVIRAIPPSLVRNKAISVPNGFLYRLFSGLQLSDELGIPMHETSVKLPPVTQT